MKVMWRTGYRDQIEKVNVIAETEHFVTVEVEGMNGQPFHRREKKDTRYSQYFETWTDAHEFLVQEAEKRVIVCSEMLGDANQALAKIEAMTEPE